MIDRRGDSGAGRDHLAGTQSCVDLLPVQTAIDTLVQAGRRRTRPGAVAGMNVEDPQRVPPGLSVARGNTVHVIGATAPCGGVLGERQAVIAQGAGHARGRRGEQAASGAITPIVEIVAR
jgi:hypothetical protein